MKSILQYLLMLLLLICLGVKQADANKYTVTSTVDNTTSAVTSGTLRWAITQANAHAGKDSVYFNILAIGNTFENSGINTFAVIQLYDSLPAIRDSLLIDGTTQTNTNLTSIPGKTVGTDAVVQANFLGPDIYIVPNAAFTFPDGSDATDNSGTGLTVMTDYAIIKGLALSGFGNTNTDPGKAQGNACITVYIKTKEEYNNTIIIQDCFLGCDPAGNAPSLAYRKTKGQGILVEPNRHNGTINHNYISYAGVNGINLNCTINATVATSPSFPVIRGWTILNNYIAHQNNNAALDATINVTDAASCLGTPRLTFMQNYIEDTYQTGLDLGHNADTSLVENNTVTNTTRTVLVLPQVGMRVTASCRAVTLQKNLIYGNTASTTFTGGIYMDGLKTTVNNANTYNSVNNIIQNNSIHDNRGSGIIIATFNNNQSTTTVLTTGNTISQNSTYNNTGLGIDLGFNTKNAVAGTTDVTNNDASDADVGPNNLQNFPIIDSAKRAGTTLTVWGKASAGATIEFFTCDGGNNKMVGNTQNYGEGKIYLATGIEGSAADLLTTNASYADVDGNAGTGAATASRFQFVFSLPVATANLIASSDSLTSTATLAGSTSEFGPQAIRFLVLSCDLKNISGVLTDNQTRLSWNAVCDNSFNYFEVEYSTDGVSYNKLGKVYGDFNNNNPKDYSFLHANPDGYYNYYRLKMIDKDGAFKYSNIIVIKLKVTENISIGPNPASDYLYINIASLKDDMAQLRIINPAGNVVLSTQEHLTTGTNAFTIKNLGRFATGIYTVQVVINDEVKNQQLLIRR